MIKSHRNMSFTKKAVYLIVIMSIVYLSVMLKRKASGQNIKRLNTLTGNKETAARFEPIPVRVHTKVIDPVVSSSEDSKTELRIKEVKLDQTNTSSDSSDIHEIMIPQKTRPWNNTLLSDDDRCTTEKSILFVILINSPVGNFGRRKELRRTWANDFTYNNYSLTVLFLLGNTQNQTLQSLVKYEFMQHRDILQGDFPDDNNALRKRIMAFKWMSNYCMYSNLVIQTNDHSFVNIFQYIKFMHPIYRWKLKHFFCRVDYTFSETDKMPELHSPFCRGDTVIMTPDLVPELYQLSKKIPPSGAVDEYLYGILPQALTGVKFVDLSNNITMNDVECLKEYQIRPNANLLACDATRPEFLYRIWRHSLSDIPKVDQSLFSNAFSSIIYNFHRNYPKMQYLRLMK